jgi:hypothetical protein
MLILIMPISRHSERISGSRIPVSATTVEEFGDDTTSQILSLFPNFVLQQIQNCIALRLVLPKGPDKTELQWTYAPAARRAGAKRAVSSMA